MYEQDVRRQLYTDEDDRQFFQWIQKSMGQFEKRLNDGCAALHHLEMHMINVACDDPGAAIGAQLILPILQERLDAKVAAFFARQADEAAEELLRMEEAEVPS